MGNIVGTIYFQNTDKDTKNEIFYKLKRLSNEHNISTSDTFDCLITQFSPKNGTLSNENM